MVTNSRFLSCITCSQPKMLGISCLTVLIFFLGYFNNRARKFMCCTGQEGIFWFYLPQINDIFVDSKKAAVSFTPYFLVTLVVSLYLLSVFFMGFQNTPTNSGTPCQYIIFLEGSRGKCCFSNFFDPVLVIVQIVEYSCLHDWTLILMSILFCYVFLSSGKPPWNKAFANGCQTVTQDDNWAGFIYLFVCIRLLAESLSFLF